MWRWANAVARADGSPRRFLRASAGTISLEFALFFAFILGPIMFIGYDFGRVGMEFSRVTSAARAGAQFGMRDQENAINEADIRLAARIDAGDLTLDVEPVFECRCPGATPDVWTVVDCDTPCADGYDQMHILVTVRSDVQMLMTYPGIPNPYTVSSRMTVRAR